MKAPKIGMAVHIPGSKKGRIAALKKLGAPEDAVNGRITAQPSEEKVCRPLPLPLLTLLSGQWARPSRPTHVISPWRASSVPHGMLTRDMRVLHAFTQGNLQQWTVAFTMARPRC